MNELIKSLVGNLNLGNAESEWLLSLVGLSILAIACLVAYWIAVRFVLRFVENLLLKASGKVNKILVEQHVFKRLAHIFPALLIFRLAPPLFEHAPEITNFLVVTSKLYVIVMIALFLDALINAGLIIYRTFDLSKQIPVKSFAQVLKLAIYFFAAISAIALVLGESPLKLLTGLGAMTAVLMLVFRDPILGLVAGLQLTSNRMVARGDWIEMPKYGVDGDVLDIALTTVKVKNFDNTITTIPTQALINDSFKNWQAMQESGGRRIKRSINIDVNSIRFCDDEMLARLSKIHFISDYIAKKSQELEEFNQHQQVDLDAVANGRRLTNIGTFRAYIEGYLRANQNINTNLTFLVRQLKPTDTGLPLEIYVFSSEKRWIPYEGIQSDIFDHIFAVIPEFGLRVFQQPSGMDIATLGISSNDSSANRRDI